MAITPAMLRRGKAISQENRLGVFHPPDDTGKGKTVGLALRRFEGFEAVNELFEFHVDCISVSPNIDFDDLLGRHCSVEIQTINRAHGPRFFDGVLTDARWLGPRDGAHGYALTLRPGLWLASLRRDQRIFHNRTAPEILTDVFARYGLDVQQELAASYPTLEYTVQYRETDLDFARRMMERVGISFHFTHRLHGHTLVLTDGNDAFKPLPGGKRPFRMVEGQHRGDSEHIREWVANRRMTTGKVSMVDYNFKSPTAAMDAEQSAGQAYEHGELESFDYPGGYPEQGDGKTLAKLRSLQEAVADHRHSASGDVLSLGAGMKMVLDGHPDPKIGGEEFVAVRCIHHFEAEGYEAGDSGSGGDAYDGQYEYVHVDTPIVPQRSITQGRIRGPQTAMVVGEGEIDCDEHGRILVKFHWDREGAHSMRCRVAQMWAGNGWGGIVIPRIGMEVVVQFLEGDPDQPLVTGSVYNGQNPPPFDLPGEKNQAGIKSNSTPGGGGYNEIVFDDTKDNELFRQHAQYDMESKVLNDERREVGNDRTTQIGHDEALTVGNDRKTTIGNDLTVTIGHDESRAVGNDRDASVGANDSLAVGKVLSVEAGQKLELKVGMSSIVLDAQSITLKSPQISVKAMTELTTSAGMSSQHSAGVSFDIKGGVVKINS